MRISLNGEWLFRRADKKEFMPAQVPGCNFTDLARLGVIPDPFEMPDGDVYEQVSKHDWIYRKSFTLFPADLAHDKLLLFCKQLDTICTLTLNGVEIGRGEDCHIEYEFDVSAAARAGENLLEIRFASPVEYVKTAYKNVKTPVNNNGQRGIVHIRKPQCHFGWDWGKCLPLSGITGEIYLQTADTARIKSVQVTQAHADGKVTLTVRTHVERFSGAPVSAAVQVLCPSGKTLGAQAREENGDFLAEIAVEDPELWWTKELSDKAEQPLYLVTVSLSGDGVLDEASCKIGLRTVRLLRDKDEYGSDFCIELNGVRVFAKGANMIPPDSFITEFTEKDWTRLVADAADANMNTIRVWGGGYYPPDLFYDLCDRAGILIWQDFAFACQAYPFFLPDFTALVKKETESVVTRLRNHPSIALWCGNNEVESMTPLWFYMPKYIRWTEKFFYGILPAEIARLDDRAYTPGSPAGKAFMKGVDADNAGDAHLWAVWLGLHGTDYYRTRFPRFCSEFGFESLPDIATVKTFADGKDLSLSSAPMKFHQKCPAGNDLIKYYIASRFRLPKSFEEFVYLSQICQAESVNSAVRHFRENKGRCNGALYWQLNDCWPVCSWSSIDYFGRYKALHYDAKRFFKPVAVSVEKTGKILTAYALNDTRESLRVSLSLSVCAYDGKVLLSRTEEVSAAPGESAKAFSLSLSEANLGKNPRAYALAVLADETGKELDRQTLLLCKEKAAALPKPKISIAVSGDEMTLASDVYARLVHLSSDRADLCLSDDYFDLLPGVTKKIQLQTAEGNRVNPDAGDITAFSAAELEGGFSVKDTLARLLIFMKPVNLFSYLYYGVKPKRVKLK